MSNSAVLPADLDSCAIEPIHIPGAIQPHGALAVLDATSGAVVQVSANFAGFTGIDLARGETFFSAFPSLEARLTEWIAGRDPTLRHGLEGERRSVIAHRSGSSIIVEFEDHEQQTIEDILPRLGALTHRMSAEPDIAGNLDAAARFVAELTGFDRVLVYKFDPDWNGHVVAEAGNGRLPTYLDLRFPSGDIPAQARRLYTINRIRVIPDVSYRPVPIVTLAGASPEPVDLSLSQLRSVSPVHIEYMRNMGTAASMSISIIIDGALWGLLSCHSVKPHPVALPVRDACEFVVQSLAMRIGAFERGQSAAERAELARVQSRLLAVMSEAPDWPRQLLGQKNDLLDLVGATGAAIVADDALQVTGFVPPAEEISAIVDWLKANADDLYHSNCLSHDLPDSRAHAASAAGIMAISLSQLHSNWLVWFRPEVVRTVKWGGDPHKFVREEGRIHPRKSFDIWREQVRDQASPWSDSQIAAARDLRAAIVGIVLRKAEELAQLSEELQRSNKELEAFSYSVSHDLRAPFRHIVGFAELLREREKNLDAKSLHYLQTISDSAIAAGRLVDDLLNFSQLGRTAIARKKVDMNKLVAEVLRSLRAEQEGRRITLRIEDLPPAFGDATLLRQVWYNLLDNAIKYTRRSDSAEIGVSGRSADGRASYTVSDNGVGFDMKYVGKVFGVFQRLQRVEDFEGTGIGLALVRRIVERHGGTVSAFGEVDQGASFSFVLPVENTRGDTIA